MATDAIVFAMANPTPEVLPEAIEGYAAVIATGRSDYPNQINNVLAFPGIFRGALDVRAAAITERDGGRRGPRDRRGDRPRRARGRLHRPERLQPRRRAGRRRGRRGGRRGRRRRAALPRARAQRLIAAAAATAARICRNGRGPYDCRMAATDDDRTESGIELKPVYAAGDAPQALEPPGEFPFTRGPYRDMYRGRPWTIRQYAGFASAEESNERYRYLLARGQTGLSVAFDLPTQLGYDSDDPRALGEVGRTGVAIDSLADMEIAARRDPARRRCRRR